MRAVVQRVKRAKVTVDGEIIGEIGNGILLLLGVAVGDTENDAEYLLNKVLALRIFDDGDGRMNLSLEDAGKHLLVVSQFTLLGDVRRGRRPSYIDAAAPEDANILYEHFIKLAQARVELVGRGRFQAMMDVELVNDGPVTILLDSKKQF